MSPIALGLLVLAAVLHAGWNLLVKRAREKQVFTWWALVVGCLCFTPLLLIRQPLPIQVWPFIFCSALIVFATLMGWRWLGEDFGALRVLGAGFLFTGILVITFAG